MNNIIDYELVKIFKLVVIYYYKVLNIASSLTVFCNLDNS